jgi:hypothetical protein
LLNFIANSTKIDTQDAIILQRRVLEQGEFLIWSISKSACRFIARPWRTSGEVIPIYCYMLDNDLITLRARLPSSLKRYPKIDPSDPIIIEIWM